MVVPDMPFSAPSFLVVSACRPPCSVCLIVARRRSCYRVISTYTRLSISPVSWFRHLSAQGRPGSYRFSVRFSVFPTRAPRAVLVERSAGLFHIRCCRNLMPRICLARYRTSDRVSTAQVGDRLAVPPLVVIRTDSWFRFRFQLA